MNRDQVKGRMKQAGGKMQAKAGKATGSLKHQAKGMGKQVSGTLQKTMGDTREDSRKGRL